MESPFIIQSRRGNKVVIDGEPLLCFAGSDYLGLARDPALIARAGEALARFGLSPSASRWTTGTTLPHEEVERAAARYCNCEDAVLLPIGYLADQALLGALDERVQVWFADERSHAAILQGLAHVRAPHHFFEHRSADALQRAIERHAPRGSYGVVAEGIYLDSARSAPLDEYAAVVDPERGIIVLDDAHTLGVLGEHGRGIREHHHAERDHIFTAATLSKAFGSFGGIVPGPRALCERVREQVALYAGATPIPAALAAAATGALELAREEPGPRERLRANIHRLRTGLARLGLPLAPEPTPIFPFGRESGLDPARAHAILRARGILFPHSHYPGSPPEGILRGTVHACHTPAEIDSLIEGFASCC